MSDYLEFSLTQNNATFSFQSPPPQNDTKFKIFIGGTTPDTDEDVLKDHFSQYGSIVDCVIMKHPQTNR